MSLQLIFPQELHFPLPSPITSLGILISLKVKDMSHLQWSYAAKLSLHTESAKKSFTSVRKSSFPCFCNTSCTRFLLPRCSACRTPAAWNAGQARNSATPGLKPCRLTLTDSPVTSAARCNNSWVPLGPEHLSFQARHDHFHVNHGGLSFKMSRSAKVQHWPRSPPRHRTRSSLMEAFMTSCSRHLPLLLDKSLLIYR